MQAVAWTGLALVLIALSILGYVLDARAHGGARLRGGYGGDADGGFSEGGGGFSSAADCGGGGGDCGGGH
jgi:hypothetical protein